MTFVLFAPARRTRAYAVDALAPDTTVLNWLYEVWHKSNEIDLTKCRVIARVARACTRPVTSLKN